MRPKRGQEVATRLNELLNSPVSNNNNNKNRFFFFSNYYVGSLAVILGFWIEIIFHNGQNYVIN